MSADWITEERVRAHLARRAVREKRMFGYLIFMVDGHMLCGVSDAGLFVRIGRAAREAALARPHVEPMRVRSRVYPASVRILPAGLATDEMLAEWLDLGLAHVGTLGLTAPAAPRHKRGARAKGQP